MDKAVETVDKLLLDVPTFREAALQGLKKRDLQLPPVINPTVFEELADYYTGSGPALRDAGRAYVLAANQADELLLFSLLFV